MKKHILLRSISACLALAAGIPAHAQFWMKDNGSLCFGDSVTTYDMGLNFRNIPGFYWQNDGHFIKMDLTSTCPRISFSNDQVELDGMVYCGSIVCHSDSASKTGIRTLGGGMSLLDSLRTLSLTRPGIRKARGTAAAEPSVRYALDAGSLQKVLPDAVRKHPDGRTAVNYTALIPLLVSSLQELQARVERQQNRLDSLTAVRAAGRGKASPLTATWNGTLRTYTLSCTLPETARDAWLQVCDSAGREIQVIDMARTGTGTLERRLPGGRGAAYCSLIVDGELAATMVLDSNNH